MYRVYLTLLLNNETEESDVNRCRMPTEKALVEQVAEVASVL
jgi:hypothetical protein